jgi:hypothetical protein
MLISNKVKVYYRILLSYIFLTRNEANQTFFSIHRLNGMALGTILGLYFEYGYPSVMHQDYISIPNRFHPKSHAVDPSASFVVALLWP